MAKTATTAGVLAARGLKAAGAVSPDSGSRLSRKLAGLADRDLKGVWKEAYGTRMVKNINDLDPLQKR